LIVDEVRSQSDEHRAVSMYNIMKPLAAAPPDWLPVNAKFQNTRYSPNCVRLFATTNEIDAMFIPEDDRRFFVVHSDTDRAAQAERLSGYWNWARDESNLAAVREWLARRSLSRFKPFAPPPKTLKHRAVTESLGYEEDHPFMVALRELGRPSVLFMQQLKEKASESLEWPHVKKDFAPRIQTRTMKRLGYVAVPSTAEGERWRVGKLDVKYGWRRTDVSIEDARRELLELVAKFEAD
jgi:hypothetical protein